jgi:hypothetical protein
MLMITLILDRLENSEVQYNIIAGNYLNILDFDSNSLMSLKFVRS